MGITEEVFWHLNPTKLQPYIKAYQEREKKRFEEMDYIGWLFGMYNFKALNVALSGLSGKHSGAKYFEQPMHKQKKDSILPDDGKELTEEEKIQATKLLFASLDAMKMNFDMNKKDIKDGNDKESE